MQFSGRGRARFCNFIASEEGDLYVLVEERKYVQYFGAMYESYHARDIATCGGRSGDLEQCGERNFHLSTEHMGGFDIFVR